MRVTYPGDRAMRPAPGGGRPRTHTELFAATLPGFLCETKPVGELERARADAVLREHVGSATGGAEAALGDVDVDGEHVAWDEVGFVPGFRQRHRRPVGRGDVQ